MLDLVIQIKKKTDGSAALSCRRADGSVTWQRQEGRQARFFPLHDLTHYAVEAVLGHPRGLRGPLPPEALVSEQIVGLLDRERAAGMEWTAAQFNACLPAACAVTDDDLRQVREKRRELFARWAALPAGETLELR